MSDHFYSGWTALLLYEAGAVLLQIASFTISTLSIVLLWLAMSGVQNLSHISSLVELC